MKIYQKNSAALITVLKNAELRLTSVNLDTPTLDARLLVEHALGLGHGEALSQSEKLLSTEEMQQIESLILRRLAHEPVWRIVGEREFWSLNFGLNEATLEPRPDSETLVEVALKQLDNTGSHHILDLGTGTGCLLLSLLHEVPSATGLGIDIAPRAVEQAQKNAERLGLSSRSSFRTGHWLEGITEKFDAIISNPPYIPSREIPELMPEVREHDPLLALDGGKDGLDVYRFLAPQMRDYLRSNGFVIFEVGAGQAEDVAKLCNHAGLVNISKHKDLSDIERCVIAFAP